MTEYIVFDFDGTIADTFEIIRNIAQIELGASNDDFKLLRDEGLKSLIKKKKIPFWKLPKITFNVTSKLRHKTNIKLFPGIVELMNGLHSNYKLGIVSGNSRQNIFETLKEYKIESLFEFIYSDSSIFGRHLVLKRMCKKYKINPVDVIHIGDEDRDIIAAKRVKIKNVAVTWGFNSKERLNKVTPDSIVDSPLQILEQIS